jgi:DNA invertase Pin-like site-specific DNA recombinase
VTATYDHVRADIVVSTRAQTSRTREGFFRFLAHLKPGPEREGS